MKKIIILLLAFCFAGSALLKAQANAWSTLAMMKYERTESTEGGGQFVKMIEALEGKKIMLKGYIIPLSGKKGQSHFMFSAFPYANCFFCGNAGPESVIEVFAKDNKKIAYCEKAIAIKGRFHFTSRDPNGVMYTLREAVALED